MTEQELAAFKAKLACLLDTSTDAEAQMISNLVEMAYGGGGGKKESSKVGEGQAGYMKLKS